MDSELWGAIIALLIVTPIVIFEFYEWRKRTSKYDRRYWYQGWAKFIFIGLALLFFVSLLMYPIVK